MSEPTHTNARSPQTLIITCSAHSVRRNDDPHVAVLVRILFGQLAVHQIGAQLRLVTAEHPHLAQQPLELGDFFHLNGLIIVPK